jgi:hypothetical protein
MSVISVLLNSDIVLFTHSENSVICGSASDKCLQENIMIPDPSRHVWTVTSRQRHVLSSYCLIKLTNINPNAIKLKPQIKIVYYL